MHVSSPLNLRAWVDQNRALLKPPVGNKLLFEDAEFIVMAVGGPNARKDFHHDPGPELFYQLEGDIVLETIQEERRVAVRIRAGEIFLLPAEVPHSPQRGAGTVGLVVERPRTAGELDGFSWYCECCGHRLYLERLHIEDIEKQLPPVFKRFFSSIEHRTCAVCGSVMAAPGEPPARSGPG
jgi:3-hydroxyanthranilate 3,4-dioxygenase